MAAKTTLILKVAHQIFVPILPLMRWLVRFLAGRSFEKYLDLLLSPPLSHLSPLCLPYPMTNSKEWI